MTIIAAAISEDGTIYMGGDAASVDDVDAIRISSSPKVFQVGEFLIGSTGTKRVTQIAGYVFKPPKHNGEDVESYIVTKFVPALRKVMDKQGGEIDDDEHGKIMNGGCLIGYRGRLFGIDSAYGVLMPALPYHAVGCGDQIGLGAMYAARQATPEEKVKIALEAAAEFDANIRGPFTIKSISAANGHRKR